MKRVQLYTAQILGLHDDLKDHRHLANSKYTRVGFREILAMFVVCYDNIIIISVVYRSV